MKNFIQPGNSIDFTAGADLVSGQGLLIGSLFGVVTGAVANGEKGALLIEGVVELPKNTATAFAVGAPVEWDDTAKELVAAAAGDIDVGYAVEAKLAADTTLKIKLSRP